MDEKAFEELRKINKDSKEKSLFPEHEFLVACLRMGLKIEDLKVLTYVDVLKMFISFCSKDERSTKDGAREATQKEIQNLVARM